MSTHLLVLAHDPAIVAAQLQQFTANQPGKATSTVAFTLEELESKAIAEKDNVTFVLLGPRTTDEEAASAKQIVARVWGRVKESKDEPGEGKWVLRIPASLGTEEGRKGGIVGFVGKQVEG
ncbi:hypothetical protein CALVIDRAFT_599850 [Calocera viscosa TUFC12733]|uniref:Uncharacterized protein n=1 Tax=Calocera viscosa (strain TUFC12733) TaxID=1330018 RepID=A0A167KBD8_CALVF|nr:hypothetical protein CALVIDRAFT_599850 [Calocera viscosa TUFC12733]